MFLLVPSPLLGPATWRPVEAWLRTQGHQAQTVDFGPKRRSPAQVLDTIVAAARDQDESIVLVPHSNAGLYAPHLVTLIGQRATVYVDAALPDPASGETDTPLAPPAFLGFLRTLADSNGILPPWSQWWEETADLFPDHASHALVEREQQRLPLTYFTSRVPVPGNWAAQPSAYLAFGDTYAAERGCAVEAGWPTVTIEGGHLHTLWEPTAVGAALLELSRRALAAK